MRVVFCTGQDLASRLVRQVDGGDFSHCGIVMPDDSVIEATYHHGVRRRRLDTLLADKPSHILLSLALPDEGGAEAFVLAQVGKPYDWTGVVGIGLDRNWQDPSAWWCSELVMAAAAAGGRRLAGNGRRVGVRLAYEVVSAWGAA